MNIFGKYIDDNEKVLKSLTKIYGIGRPTATELCMTFGVGLDKKVKDLSKDTWSTLIKAAELGPQKYKDLVKELQDSGHIFSLNSSEKAYPAEGKGGVDSLVTYSADLADAINLFVCNQDSASAATKLDTQVEFVKPGKLRSQKVEVRALTDLRERLEVEKKMKSYRGLRHLEGLPVRGQRTSTNALTVRKRKKSS